MKIKGSKDFKSSKNFGMKHSRLLFYTPFAFLTNPTFPYFNGL